VVFNELCPNIFETVSMGTPFERVTEVAKELLKKKTSDN
jgi:hypothetical protein